MLPITREIYRTLLSVVLVTGLTWGVLWPAAATAVGAIIWAVDPDSLDPGAGFADLAPAIGFVGFICGVVFGTVVFFAERRKTIAEISMPRVAMWGALVSAAFLLLAGKDIRMIIILGPLGAASGLASVTIVRRWLRWRAALRASC